MTAAVAAQEVPLTGVQYGPAPFDRQNPQVASDGTNFLAAWRDGRTSNGDRSIFAARFAPDGRLLDEPTAIAVPDARDDAPAFASNSAPAVAWTGRLFVVAWSDPALGLQRVRIDRDGRLLDARPLAIAGTGDVSSGAAATAGGRTLIVWDRHAMTEGKEALGATLLDEDGEVLIDRVTIASGLDHDIVVASNGNGFLATWLRWNGTNQMLMVASISRDGVVGTPRQVNLSTAAPLIAANNGEYLVTYATATRNLVMERFDTNGNSLGASAPTIGLTDSMTAFALGPYGSGYIYTYATWEGFSRALLVDRGGNVFENRIFNVSHGSMAFASNGSVTAVVWPEADSRYAQPVRMYARVLDEQGAPTLISRSAPWQSEVRAATNGNGYLAAFLDWPAGRSLRVARVSANGARLDGDGILIDDANVQEPAQVAFDGSNYVVAWKRANQCELRVTRVTPDGALLDGPRGRVTVPACADFAIGSNGTETLLVWNEFGSDQQWSIFAQRLKQDGTLDPSILRIPARDHFGSQFSIAWSHGTWLVAWREAYVAVPQWQFPIYQYNVLATRISAGGTLLDGVPIVVAESILEESVPAVAASDRDFFVAWREIQPARRSNILARRIGLDGVPGTVVEVGQGNVDFRYTTSIELSVLPAGANYLVAWEDEGDLFTATAGSGIRTPLTASRDDERNVTLLPSPAGLAAFYERVAGESEYGKVSRAFVRFLGIAPRGRAARH